MSSLLSPAERCSALVRCVTNRLLVDDSAVPGGSMTATRAPPANRMPTAATCSSTLFLPSYKGAASRHGYELAYAVFCQHMDVLLRQSTYSAA